MQTAFPTLPDREQFNRLQRHYRDIIVAFSLFLVEYMQAQCCLYEALDSSGIPTRDAKRRGSGWLASQADIGWSNRIGWYEGFHLLTSITPTGVITGFGFAAGSCNDHTLAETFFAVRAQLTPPLPSVGAPAQGVYLADKGFAGDQVHRQWYEQYGAQVVSPPHQKSKVRWSKDWRRWLAGLRQIIETIYGKLLNTFRLARERPHALDGFQARLAAKVALHNFCIWLNVHSEVSSNLARYDGIRYGFGRDAFGEEAQRRIMLGTYSLSAGYYDAYYAKAQKVRTLIVEDFAKAFEEVDVVIGPTSPSTALSVGSSKNHPMFGEVSDALLEPSSIAGLPGISICCGFSKELLPISMQVIGPYFMEDLILNVANQYEQVTDWSNRKPNL
ncbi:MAG: amidase family protein [Ktedonobacteraceae bacterium]